MAYEFQPAKIDQRVQRRIHLLQVVVIFGTDKHAQSQWLSGRCRRHLWHRFQRVLSIQLDGARGFPIARFERARRGAVGGKKRRREITVLDANKIFSALPETRAPLIQAVQLLMKERRDFAAFAVVGLDRFHGSGIRHRQIAEAAKPAEPRSDGLAVELDGGFHADHVAVIKLEMLGDFQVAVAPREFKVGRGLQFGRG